MRRCSGQLHKVEEGTAHYSCLPPRSIPLANTAWLICNMSSLDIGGGGLDSHVLVLLPSSPSSSSPTPIQIRDLDHGVGHSEMELKDGCMLRTLTVPARFCPSHFLFHCIFFPRPKGASIIDVRTKFWFLPRSPSLHKIRDLFLTVRSPHCGRHTRKLQSENES